MVRTRFPAEKMVKATEQLYDEVLKKRTKGNAHAGTTPTHEFLAKRPAS
jgi:hypothetical protein